ncbi:3892_t:CDS:2, partial [Funneliformis caledonium]
VWSGNLIQIFDPQNSHGSAKRNLYERTNNDDDVTEAFDHNSHDLSTL